MLRTCLYSLRNVSCLCVRTWTSRPLTDIAVLSCPSLVTLTLPLFTHAVLAAQRVAGFLVAHGSRPALLAPTHAAVTDAVAAAVHFTHFCWQKDINTHVSGTSAPTFSHCGT